MECGTTIVSLRPEWLLKEFSYEYNLNSGPVMVITDISFSLYYISWVLFIFSLCVLVEELTAPRDLTDEPMVTTPSSSPVVVSLSLALK